MQISKIDRNGEWRIPMWWLLKTIRRSKYYYSHDVEKYRHFSPPIHNHVLTKRMAKISKYFFNDFDKKFRISGVKLNGDTPQISWQSRNRKGDNFSVLLLNEFH